MNLIGGRSSGGPTRFGSSAKTPESASIGWLRWEATGEYCAVTSLYYSLEESTMQGYRSDG
jgi:hypothetical protein